MMFTGFNVFFYADNRDRKPVEAFIDELPNTDQVAILRTVLLLKGLGVSMGMPHTKKLKGSNTIWELRCDRNGRNFRVFYGPLGQQDYILLHAIVKPQRAIRSEDVLIAKSRLTDYLRRAFQDQLA